MYKTIKRAAPFRFRRFCRAAYAAYNSMHREVTIGHLATYIADRQLHKAAAAVVMALLLPAGQAMAQSDDTPEERTLPTVEVILTADTTPSAEPARFILNKSQISNTSVRSIGDLLALLPGIDLRARGGNDVQADLSMHGGTFDQMVLLLNGVNFTDAQTGHHTMDIPIDIAMIERVELFTPAQLAERGVVAFCGGVNIVVCEEYRDHMAAELSGGSYGMAKASLLGTKILGPWALTAAAAYNRSDGYMRNTDYRYGSLYLQATHHASCNDWHLQVGGQIKDFGSQAFYSTSYPDQFEATRTLTLAATNIHRFRRARLESTAYGRLHRDRFELFREGYVEAPSWYSDHNRHLSGLSGLRSRLVYGNTTLGAEVRSEGIASNVLGDHRRTSGNLFGSYLVDCHDFSLRLSALVGHNTQFGFNYALAADAAYKLSLHWNLHAAVSRTYRMPTFTDLYYQSVTQQANPDLNSEDNFSLDFGTTYNSHSTFFSTQVYYRRGRNIIDWVRRAGEEMWYSMNHTAVDAVGIDMSFHRDFKLRDVPASLGGSYAYCHIVQDAGEWISGSALDYLRYKAGGYLSITPLKRLSLKVDAMYRYREGVYALANGQTCPYGGVLLLGASADYGFKHVVLFVEGHNLTDRHYRDHGGVPQQGIAVVAGVRFK